MQVCGQTESAAEALRAVETLHPDFAIIDLTLEGPSGIELLKDLQIRFPKLPVLVLSMHDENLYAERALRAGRAAIWRKRSRPRRCSSPSGASWAATFT